MAISSKEAQRALSRVVPIVTTLISDPKVKAFLRSSKQKGREILRRQDFMWYEILLSLATWGSSRGAQKLNFDALTYEKLSRLQGAGRRSRVASEFRSAGLRYAKKKTGYLLHNFCLVKEKGGVDAANRAVLHDAGERDAKIKALREYSGIGEKYANNIMMDAYHPQFHDSIAVDLRIRNISKELGLRAGKYNDYVGFYRKVASRVGIQPWELDRVLYRFEKPVLHSLRGSGQPMAELIQRALAPTKN
jgi:hypothetical protein